WRFFGVQALLGGMILSALVHPWFYVAVFIKLSLGHPVLPEAGGLWALCCFNLAAGYAVGIMLGLIVAQRSNGRIALVSALLVPVYWLAISAASYRALIDLRRRPFYWEKTPHVAREVTAAPSSP
ncbi:MAG: glycosyl transferase family 2, partial [Hyphomicrobium sp.]